MADEEQRMAEPGLSGTGFCSRSLSSDMLAPRASQSPGLIPRIDQRAMICSMLKTASRRANLCFVTPSRDKVAAKLSSSFLDLVSNTAGPSEVLEGKFLPSKLLVVAPSRRFTSRA